MSKIKVDTRIEEEDFKALHEIADSKYDGNFSLCLRVALKSFINSSMFSGSFTMEVSEVVSEEMKRMADESNMLNI